MRTITGIPVSEGIAIGTLFVIDEHEPSRVPLRRIRPEEAAGEAERLELARRRSIDELNGLHALARSDMGDEAAKIFLFHIGALNDRSLIDPMRALIREELVAAEYAVASTIRRWVQMFEARPDPTFQTKISDLRDLSSRLLSHLFGQRRETLAEVSGPTIVVAPDLTPTQTAGLNRDAVVGFATDRGGKTSHTSIIARALGLPAVVGAVGLSGSAEDGCRAIVDGDRGRIVLDPDPPTIEHYRGLIEARRVRREALDEIRDLPSVTPDGVTIHLQGNIEFPAEIDDVLRQGGSGVGLYRTEFLFLSGDGEPDEMRQYHAYRESVARLEGRPLTIRTSDLGADKHTRTSAIVESNPFLGLRSIRYCLQNQGMFRTQLRAILRASAHGPMRIMFPMVTTTQEFRQARLLLNDVMEDLHDEGIAFDRSIPLGIMVEVPSVALTASTFASEVDFFSIGTNDLIQYTLAVDRINERVANLYQPTHPAVLKLIRDTTRAARRAGIEVSCCGEAASDPEFAAVLIGLGVRTLSVTPSAIPVVKRLVRAVPVSRCERIAARVIAFDSEVEVIAYLRDRIRKLIPEAYDDVAVPE